LVREVDLVIVLGSRNSSNSNRLAELAKTNGKPGYLIDTAAELNDAWFEGIGSVLITAGASAPEDVVQDCLRVLEERFGATVENRVVREEHVSFPLPRELTMVSN